MVHISGPNDPMMPMRPLALLFAAGLVSCATGRFDDSDLSTATLPLYEGPEATAPSGPPAPKAVLGGDGYTRLSVGSFSPDGDISSLDTGYYGQVAFGAELIPFLAAEASVGYLSADGSANQELWAVPLFLSARGQLPVFILEAYAGLGIGGMYVDYEFGPVNDSDFLLAGTGFAGLEIGLGNLAVGLEYRYLASEDADPGFAVEGHSGMLTLTLPF
jgi:opacity protein-like surface antigen